MSMLADKLAGLRRQAGSAAVRPAATQPEAPGSGISHDLRRWLAQREHRVAPQASSDRELPGEEIAPGLRLLQQRVSWPLPPSSIDAGFARLDRFDTHNLLHFDTETTGLAGGSGTRAFMIGAAHWHGDELVTRVLWITTLAAESAMLRTFAGWVGPDTALVSYNGKCFDAPLLATRYRLARLPNPLAGLPHIDLLHPARRAWRGVYANCRLATIEREVLKIVREDDLPGSEAPAAFRDFLRGGSAGKLRRVVAHNLQDVRSLAALLLRMAAVEH